MMARLNLVTLGMAFFAAGSSYAKPAQADFKLDDLRGSVEIEFHDVRIPKGEISVLLKSETRTIDKGKYITECHLILRDKDRDDKKQNLRVLERTIKYDKKEYGQDKHNKTFQFGSFVNDGPPHLICKVYELVGENFRLDEAKTKDLTVGEIQETFGTAKDKAPRIVIHLGSENLASLFKKGQGSQTAYCRNSPQTRGSAPVLF